MSKSKALVQAYEMQDFTYRATMALRDGMLDGTNILRVDKEGANAIGTLVRAWQVAQEQVRIHRNKPLPGSLRPTRKSERPADGGGLVS